MKTSIKTNFFYNNLLSTTKILFPLISFPYVSRIIGPEGIGICSFINNFTTYFILVAALGIPLYGVREIAKCRENQDDLNATFSELFIIQFITTILIFIIFIPLVQQPLMLKDEKLLKIFALLLLGTNFISIDWLFKGLEQYKFIGIRTLILRFISVLLMFIFITTAEHYWRYFGIMVIFQFMIGIANIIIANKFISITFRNLKIKKHLRPILIFFSSQLAINIYVNLDIVMLGFLSNSKETGYYTASMKLTRIVLTFVTSLGVVLIPRISNYISNNQTKEVSAVLQKSFHFISLLSIPTIIGIILVGTPLMTLFTGEQFSTSPILMITLSPLILIIALSNLFGMQILIPIGKEKFYLIAVVSGAILNLSLNFIFIPHFHSMGAVIASIAAESIVLCFSFYFAKKYFPFTFSPFIFLRHLLLSTLFIPLYFICSNLISNSIAFLIFMIFGCGIIYTLGLHLTKDKLFQEEILPGLNKRFR